MKDLQCVSPFSSEESMQLENNSERFQNVVQHLARHREANTYSFESLHREMLESAVKNGFRIARRPRDHKPDESEAQYLPDISRDDSWDLWQQKPVTVSHYNPLLLGTDYIDREADDESNSYFAVLAFVEVPSKLGKLKFKHRYCALVDLHLIENQKPQLKKDASGKVLLYWMGSLRALK